MTELLYLRDAQLTTFEATVTDVVDGTGVVLDRTAFYVTGGGQPHDTGTLGETTVSAVRRDRASGQVVHVLDGPVPEVGERVCGRIDWDRRHALMRTHSAVHVLCGVIWNQYRAPVTGGNMEPLTARLDIDLDPLPADFAAELDAKVNDEITAARPIEVFFLPRGVAVEDDDLIRTKVNLIPETVEEIRVVDIIGLDRQADGGTHVTSTDQIGRVKVVKTESKGKGNKRIRFEVVDA